MDSLGTAQRWRALVGVLLTTLLLCGAVTVARFHVWAEIDERHHYAYVQEVAEHGRLPRIGDPVSWQAWAIGDPVWPRPKPVPPERAGVVAQSYEAWQPPLYYVMAAPAFLVADDHRDKVFVLRAFDLGLVLAAVGLLWRLARRALPEAPLAAFAGGVLVLLWPGVLARAITVSNTSLEMVMTCGVLLALERAWARRDGRRLLAAGVLAGAALLTKLALVFLVPGLILVAFLLRREAPRHAIVALVAPPVLLAPWLALNESRYGALTANAASQRQLEPIVYPPGTRPGVGALPDRLGDLTEGVLPQEWLGQLDVPWVRAAALVLFVALCAGGTAAAVRDRTPLALLAGLAAAAYLVIFSSGQVSERWDVLLIRHAYPLLPAIGVAAGAWLWRQAGDRAALATTVACAVLLGALWADMAGRFYFTDLGARLGI